MLLSNFGGYWRLFPQDIELTTHLHLGHAVVQLLKAVCYKLEGRGFDSQ